jgi:hypothetical protein
MFKLGSSMREARIELRPSGNHIARRGSECLANPLKMKSDRVLHKVARLQEEQCRLRLLQVVRRTGTILRLRPTASRDVPSANQTRPYGKVDLSFASDAGYSQPATALSAAACKGDRSFERAHRLVQRRRDAGSVARWKQRSFGGGCWPSRDAAGSADRGAAGYNVGRVRGRAAVHRT